MRVWLDRQAMAARRLTVRTSRTRCAPRTSSCPQAASNPASANSRCTRTPACTRRAISASWSSAAAKAATWCASAKSRTSSSRPRTCATSRAPTASLAQPRHRFRSRRRTCWRSRRACNAEMGLVKPTLPPDIKMGINIDDTVFVRGSINEVIHALVIALLLVLIVIYLFLGTLRATLIPAVTIPVSIVSASIIMVIAGFSINVLTLLGAVLAIGLVVDDAIVVLENIVRRIELGQPPLLAAVDGSKEIGFAVVATTLVLIAVFLPISFIPGNIGRLFGEFGITIAAAIGFSALVSLTLVPMMSSKILRARHRARTRRARGRQVLPLVVERLRALAAQRAACASVDRRRGHRPRLRSQRSCSGCCLPSTLRPRIASASTSCSRRRKARACSTWSATCARSSRSRCVEVGRAMRARDALAHRQLRRRQRGQHRPCGCCRCRTSTSARNRRNRSQRAAAAIAESCRHARRRSPTPGGLGIRGFGSPVQIVLGGGDYAELARWRDIILARRAENPGLTNLDSDFYARKPQLKVSVDRNRAADLGVSLHDCRPHARDDDGLAHRHDVPRSRRGIQRDAAGSARTTARRRAISPTSTCAPRPTNSLIPLSNLVQRRGNRRSDRAQALRPAARRHDHRQPQSRLFARRGARLHGDPGAHGAAGRMRRSTTTASRASSSAPARRCT